MLPKIIGWMTEEEYNMKKDKYDKIKSTENPYSMYPLADKQQKEVDSLIPYVSECNIDAFHIDALIQELVKNRYVICGDTHQRLAIPVFEDGYFFVSMRYWSEIMASAIYYIFPHRAVRERYSKSDFYMAATCRIKERFPNAFE